MIIVFDYFYIGEMSPGNAKDRSTSSRIYAKRGTGWLSQLSTGFLVSTLGSGD